MLDYKDNRLDYGQMLIPPPGYRLAKAIAATYTLDLNTLLSIPIALFYAQTLEGEGENEGAADGSDHAKGERIQLLEAVQRCPEVLRIYHQKGKIQVPREQNRLYGLLENCVVGVPPRNVFSSFHPKVWVLRYEPLGEKHDGPVRYRFIVLSRNLTFDRSWDIAANLEGAVSQSPRDGNQPLVDFARFLVNQEPPTMRFEAADQFLADLSRVEFAAPKGFNGNFRFHPIGIEGYPNPLLTQQGTGLICISPFVHEDTLAKLRKNVPEDRWLFSREEELQKLQSHALQGFNTYSLSRGIVDGEFLSHAEDGASQPLEQNLHAKLFIYKRGSQSTVWFVGSANATKAALEKNRNVEFLLEMRGSSQAVQFQAILSNLLGPEPERNLGVFERFESKAEPNGDDAQKALEQKVRRLEFDLLTALDVVNAELVLSENSNNFDLLLSFQPGNIKPGNTTWGDFEVKLSPFNSDHAAQPLAPQGVTDLRFENISESNLSRFLRFEIFHDGKPQRAFLMKIDITGLPAGRISKILQGIISDQGKFFEYLHVLLASDFDKGKGSDQDESHSPLMRSPGARDFWDLKSPLFEQLLIAASRRPNRLREIDHLIHKLQEGAEQESAEQEGEEQDRPKIVPQEFLTLWKAFQGLLPATAEVSP